MRLRSVRRLAALTGVLALLLSACGGESGGGDPGPSTGSGNGSGSGSGAPVSGGELNYALQTDPACVDPQQRPQLIVRMIGRQLTDSLTEQDPKTGEILPWLASSWEISDDVRSFTFQLRDDVTFSDGTAFDAEAVKANFDRVIELGAGAPQAIGFLEGYEKSTVVDEHTIKVDFDEPNVQFLQATSTQSLGMLSPKTLALDPEEACLGNISGTGPFELESYTPQQGVVLKRRDDYAWGSPIGQNKGAAYLDTVNIKIIPEAGVRTGSLTSGQIDAMEGVPVTDVKTFDQNSAVSLVTAPLPAISISYIPHVFSPYLGDVRVRQALALGLNRQQIVDTVFAGVYKAATGVLTPNNPGYVNQEDKLRFDPAEAAKLLDEAGWDKIGEDGIRVNSVGEKLSLEIQYVGTGTPAELMHQLVQAQWKEIGVHFVLKPVNELPSVPRNELPFDVNTWSQTRGDSDVLRSAYSSFFPTLSMLYGNPDENLDPLLSDLQTTVDPKQRKEIAAEAQDIVLDQAYAIPVYDMATLYGLTSAVQGFTVDMEGKPLFAEVWKKQG